MPTADTATGTRPTASQLPQWWAFVHPVLTVMTDGTTRTVKDMERAVIGPMQLTETARAETLDSGVFRLTDRVRWAVTYTHRAGFLERVTRGQYRLTETGRTWLTQHPEPFTATREATAVFRPYWESPADTTAGGASSNGQSGTAGTGPASSSGAPARTAPGTAGASGSDPAASAAGPPLSGQSPAEQIEAAVALVEQEVAAELLTRLRGSDPDFFEEAVVKVLLGMGYGGAEQRGRRIGGTGDGGVDGVIDQDALGLDQIYVQAKRYAEGNTVGRETIQAFVGALQGRGTSRGVFITSSSFTRGAIEYAQLVPTRVILIDGARLAALMIKYRVGVQVQQSYHVVEIDEDFFE